MKKLLCILNNMNAGGAETFLMKIYRNIDRTKYQMDFCINVKEKCFYEDEIHSLGGRVFRITSKSNGFSAFRKELSELIASEKYEHVLRITSNAMGFLDLKIAKKAGAKICCARSSNSSDGNGLMLKISHLIGRAIFLKYVDIAIAPSDLAARYTFGNKMYRDNNVHIINNAVDLDVYQYKEISREQIRKEFNIPLNAMVIGHIGRFMEQKNHLFLADVFNVICRSNSNVVLMLVGEGPLKQAFEERITEYGLSEKVKYLGIRRDIPDVLSAMDVLVFPSLYEGMPNTVIEAQATGLPCVISNTITRDADITGLIKYISLNEKPELWAEMVISSICKTRKSTKEMFVKQRYDVNISAGEFIDLLFHKKQESMT